jgi:hypothetical protein
MPMDIKTNSDCSRCPHTDSCKAAYEALGKSTAPSVVGKVVLAFVVPMVVFIGVLVGLDALLPAFGTEKRRMAVISLLGFGLTFATVWFLKKIRPHAPKNRKVH